VGVGSGETFLKIATLVGPAGRAVGMAVTPEALALTRARLTEVRYENFDLHAGGAESLPFDPQSFDAAYCGYVLNFLSDGDVARVLGELKRVLRPGGRLVLCGHTPGEKTLTRAVSGSWRALHKTAPKLTRNSRPLALLEASRAAGFAVDRRLYLEQRAIPSEVLLLVRPSGLGLAM
jgi:demethylmenaquinone methyltransferase/2-methoxy-6-polyprenyl-1,4-benzoquinol methylase